jgi:hypothetical protein
MKRVRRRLEGKGGLELVEEATHLLRTAPAAALAAYYIGAIPFVLGLLYFWADMSRSPYASQHLADAALGMAALFVWLKFWQAVFASRIRAHIAAETPPPWTVRQCWRVLVTQTILQPSGLFVLPLSLVPALPFAWSYAFYQNITALAGGDTGEAGKLLKKSWRQAVLWPRQNHIALAAMSAFGFFVFLSWAIVCLSLPGLIKMLFGIESIFTQSPYSMLNTTFFTAVCGLTYLCVDPILKVIYALRCFHGESLQSGEDLKAGLKHVALSAQQMAAGLAILLAMAGAASSPAAGTNPPPAVPAASPQMAPPAVSPPELDRAINEVIHERKYTWRMPREKIVEPEAQPGIIARFLERVGAMLRKWARAVLDWLDELLRKLFPRRSSVGESGTSGYGWILSLEILLYALVAAVVSALAVLLYRLWRDRRRKTEPVASEAIQPLPDVTDENVGADQLPEDGWTMLAHELLGRGELRLAMRAFYLASLAHLAERNLISIARFKSNRDYERELRRRGHSFPDLLPVFGENISVFERIWYGMHEVNHDLVGRFAANVEKIRIVG